MTAEMEVVERAGLESLHAVAPAALRETLGLRCEVIGTALVSLAAAAPPSAIVVNRALGLGVGSPADPEAVAAITDLYAASGVTRYFVHVHPDAAPPEIRSWLLERGLERARSWMKFTRGREAPPVLTTPIQVREALADDMPDFARIAAAAFDLGADLEPWLMRLGEATGWRAYVGVLDRQVVATGALFVHGEIGWMDFAATTPACRGRGAQGALLCHRIACALDLGCRALGTATGEAVAGDPQHSYRNILRTGFREAYLRDNYAPLGESAPRMAAKA